MHKIWNNDIKCPKNVYEIVVIFQIISQMRSLPRFIGAGWRGMDTIHWIVFDLICMWFETPISKLQQNKQEIVVIFQIISRMRSLPRFIGAGWRGMEVEARRGESTGNISATIAMSDLTWNSWNTKYKIQIQIQNSKGRVQNVIFGVLSTRCLVGNTDTLTGFFGLWLLGVLTDPTLYPKWCNLRTVLK